MINIIELAKKKDEILQENLQLYCPTCSEKWYSVFDRLFILVYDECYDCVSGKDEQDAETKSENIMALL